MSKIIIIIIGLFQWNWALSQILKKLSKNGIDMKREAILKDLHVNRHLQLILNPQKHTMMDNT